MGSFPLLLVVCLFVCCFPPICQHSCNVVTALFKISLPVSGQHSRLHFIGNIHLIQEHDWSQLLQSVDVRHLAAKLVANKRLQKYQHHADEVGRMYDVELLQILLVPAEAVRMNKS